MIAVPTLEEIARDRTRLDGLSFAALQSHTFSSLFGLPVSALFDHYRTSAPSLLNLCMHSGVRVFGRAHLRLSNSSFQHALFNAATMDGEPGTAATGGPYVPPAACHAATSHPGAHAGQQIASCNGHFFVS